VNNENWVTLVLDFTQKNGQQPYFQGFPSLYLGTEHL